MIDKLTQLEVESKIVFLRNVKVILDSDVAALYGVETKRVNEAVKNNPDKFPEGYVIALNNDEAQNLRSKISTTNQSMTRVNPKAFTEKGLYMLATILKSTRATQTTLNKQSADVNHISEIPTLREAHKNYNRFHIEKTYVMPISTM